MEVAGLLPEGTLKIKHTGYMVIAGNSKVQLQGFGLGLYMYINQSSSSKMGMSILHSYGVFETIVDNGDFSTSSDGVRLVLSASTDTDSSTITVTNKHSNAIGFHICWVGLKI